MNSVIYVLYLLFLCLHAKDEATIIIKTDSFIEYFQDFAFEHVLAYPRGQVGGVKRLELL